MADVDAQIRKSFQSWYSSLRPMKPYRGRPAKGLVAAALVVLERLRSTCELSLDAHLAEGGAQIAGLNLSSLRKILDRFGESRRFPSEGGRTNRGNNRPIQLLLESLSGAGFAALSEAERLPLLDEFQEFLVKSLNAYYNLERVRFDFDRSDPPRNVIADILAAAQERNQAGPVAQHLVGAKLAIRFPGLAVGNSPHSAADEQTGRSGDFHIGNTAFHVTVAPNMGHVKRCAQNVKDGLSAMVLVPDSKLAAARALLETEGIENKVVAESLESFIGQNLSELAEFAPAKFAENLSNLLGEYNRRVAEVETDESLMIELPATLRSAQG
ncbi:MAG TPA: DUF4928 family protein [Sedimentisphaerales bacterium]|nr:DUF4928 family protein [Sedimentisphaerales bacterium]